MRDINRKSVTILILSFILISVSMLLIAGCSKKADQELRIGVIAPLTGDAAIYGSALKKGLDLANEEINKIGVVKDGKISLLYEDSSADPKTAVSAFNKLVTVDKVSIIIGDMFSSTTLSIAPLAQKNSVVLLSPTASSEEVPKTGDFVFTIYPSDTYDGQFVGNFVASTLQKKTAAVIYVQAEAMVAAKNSFVQAFSATGGSLLLEEGYPPKTDDFRSLLSKIKSGKPEIVFVPGYLDEIVRILTQAKEIGIKSQFVTISTAYDEKLLTLAKNTAEGLILSAPFFDQASKQPEIVAFEESFRKKYRENPNVWAAYGYDALMIIAKAYNNSLISNTPLNVELSKIKGFMGTTGKTTFLENRKVEKQLRMMIVSNNEFVEYR